jgi:flagellar basal-body rod modification protein FlgD
MMLQQLNNSPEVIQPQKNQAIPVQNSTAGGNVNRTNPGGITETLNYDDFLKLLIMQLKYQDPLEPLDNSAFVAQNAQFSTVEQLMAIKDTLLSQTSAMEAANATYATSMMGKIVAADVSDYNEMGEYEEQYISGIVTEVHFLKTEGEILLKLDNDIGVYLSQIVSVKEPEE